MSGVTRREFLVRSGATTLSSTLLLGTAAAFATRIAAAAPRRAPADAEGILVASLLDRTGGLETIGVPMSDATTFSIEDINANGGVLGQQLNLQALDTQFQQAVYTQYAQQLALDPAVAVVMGGITSASREAIRPLFHSARKVYFSNEQY